MASGGLIHMIRCSLTWAWSLATGVMSLRQSLCHYVPGDQVQQHCPAPLRTQQAIMLAESPLRVAMAKQVP